MFCWKCYKDGDCYGLEDSIASECSETEKVCDPATTTGNIYCVTFLVQPTGIAEVCRSEPLCCIQSARYFFLGATYNNNFPSGFISNVILTPDGMYDTELRELDPDMTKAIQLHYAIQQNLPAVE